MADDLRAIGCRWAVVGGMAVSVRAEPRTTLDIDVAVALPNDRGAETMIRELRGRGYRDNPAGALLEQTAAQRLAGFRMFAPALAGEPQPLVGVPVDLLFASSGVESEIVAAAETVEVIPGLSLPIAQTGHLIALKVLAGRSRDLEDCRALLRGASPHDLDLAIHTLDLIAHRGFNRGKDLQAKLCRLKD